MEPAAMTKRQLRDIAAGKKRLPAAHGDHWTKMAASLQKNLKDVGLSGRVVSVLVHPTGDKAGINVYGKRIDHGIIFGVLNLSIGVSSRISNPRTGPIEVYKEGHFVPGAKFGLTEKNVWVALIGISVSQAGLDDAVSFPRKPIS